MKVTDFSDEQLHIILCALANLLGYKVLSVQHNKLNLSVNTPAGAKTFHWNPLVDNRDSFDLMCKLGLKVDVNNKLCTTVASSNAIIEHEPDAESATRLAIVLAAYEYLSNRS